jgi:hypothetical protein
MAFEVNNRASSIFPVYVTPNGSTKIIFLGYWSIKNNLVNVQCVISLYDKAGTIVDKNEFAIEGTQVYEISAAKWLQDLNIETNDEGFLYTIEVELFFDRMPRFTYPAIAVVIEGPEGTSAVHSCVRTFNANEKPNDDILKKPQTGFDIFQNNAGDIENFVVFTAGGEQDSYVFSIVCEDDKGNKLDKEIILSDLRKNQLCEINISHLFGDFIRPDTQYKVQLNHNIIDIFPRFYCGNYGPKHTPTLTHSFFETLNVDETTTRKHEANNIKQKHDVRSVFHVPLFPASNYDTSISFYASNEVFDALVYVEFYNVAGQSLAYKTIPSTPLGAMQRIERMDLVTLAEEYIQDFDPQSYYSIKFNIVPTDGIISRRMKMGLNISRCKAHERGTNICFSSVYVDEMFLTKPCLTSWSPIGGKDNMVVIMHDVDLLGENNNGYLIKTTFYNSNSECLVRKLPISPNGTIILDRQHDKELTNFLGTDYGWVYIEAPTNFLSTWYFSLGNSLIGGDHSF